MIVEFGNTNADDGDVVTQVRVTDDKREDGSYVAGFVTGTDAQVVRDHLFDNPGLVTHLPGNELIPQLVNSWREHAPDGGRPTWVNVRAEARDAANAADIERFLGDFYRCPTVPDDVEDTHWTLHGSTVYPPGQAPEAEPVVTAVPESISL